MAPNFLLSTSNLYFSYQIIVYTMSYVLCLVTYVYRLLTLVLIKYVVKSSILNSYILCLNFFEYMSYCCVNSYRLCLEGPHQGSCLSSCKRSHGFIYLNVH